MGRGVYIFRLWCGFGLLTLGFVALAWHLFDIQIVRHEELLAKARETYTTSQLVTGQRGQIRDRQGHLLVGNLACKDILAEPRKVKAEEVEQVTTALAQALSLDREVLARRFGSGSVEIVVAKAIPMDQAATIEALKLPGVRLVDRPRRYYAKNSMAANILGFTDADNQGVFGLEKVWDKELSPSQSRLPYERDRRGRLILRSAPDESPEETLAKLNGQNLYLTIDEPIQTIMERELAALGEEHAPRYAFAIMANPHTGAIMAMAQWPTFDPNDRSHMDPRLWMNHMISDVYDPGSTMKCVAVAGALDYGLVTLDTKVDCEMGRWVYGGRSLRDSDHQFGRISVSDIIQHSSNIGTAKIALMMGEKRLYQVFRRFGYGQKTGIGLPDESRGILRETKNWDTLSITRFPIGQGISVTPPQMVQAYSAIANGGELIQLHLVERLENPATGAVTRTEGESAHLNPLENQRCNGNNQ